MACRSCSSSRGLLPQRPALALPRSLFLDTRSSTRRSMSLPSSPAPSCSPSSSLIPKSTTTPFLIPRTATRRVSTAPSSPAKPKESAVSSMPEAAATIGGSGGLLQQTRERLFRSNNYSSYATYRCMERIAKACASQANYTIDDADRKNGTVAMTAEGEEIGRSIAISEGWHTSKGLVLFFPWPGTLLSTRSDDTLRNGPPPDV
jgi:hypothetical protein